MIMSSLSHGELNKKNMYSQPNQSLCARHDRLQSLETPKKINEDHEDTLQ
jgi:hypothetical protein